MSAFLRTQAAMPEQLLQRVEHCYQQAETFFKRPFARAEVSFKLRGQKAGVAHLTENKLRFNPQLYRENRDDFLKQTVPHEVAHLIAHQLFGPKIQPHGEEWQLIMRGVYELPPNRCHSYAVQRRTVSRYIYRCSCAEGEFPFSAQRHALVSKGRRYYCRRCKVTLRYTGEQRLE
ncbi:SprT family zinc-dependent metalloprotease [Pseudomonas sp. 32.2.56]|uniref:SprT family zinc-dependent metalloprotease n=1 Tax=Pseudomonas sp. 32.2.56 TaxID=2969303 RepID=UPI00215048A3|nr:SprT family zinc-dependent metalloprotease [Pseudomonas sp. 32.2.56]MCR4510348.1 SprT family zinc-dependent metalloprotease [Pseudomonas sp. 32.2.56]